MATPELSRTAVRLGLRRFSELKNLPASVERLFYNSGKRPQTQPNRGSAEFGGCKKTTPEFNKKTGYKNIAKSPALTWGATSNFTRLEAALG